MRSFKIIQEWSFIEQTNKKYFQVKRVINKTIDGILAFNICASSAVTVMIVILWLFVKGQLQCGFKYVQWMEGRPTGSTTCPNSLKWTSCDLKSWSSSKWSPRGRGCSTVASRWVTRSTCRVHITASYTKRVKYALLLLF